jgi:hypothetical protein
MYEFISPKIINVIIFMCYVLCERKINNENKTVGHVNVVSERDFLATTNRIERIVCHCL